MTVFAGLIVVEAAAKIEMELAIYYSGASFLGYLAAFSVQTNKESFLLDQLGDGLMDIGSLALVLAFVALLVGRRPIESTSWILIVAALSIWLVDHVIRWSLTRQYLIHLERNRQCANKDREIVKMI